MLTYAVMSLATLLTPVVGCGGGTPEPAQPTVHTEQGEVPAPPPGGETEIKTEDEHGNEKKTTIEVDKDD